MEVLLTDGKEEPLSGWVLDRSMGGVGVMLDKPLPEGLSLKIRPRKASEDTPWIAVHIKSCRQEGDQWEVGLQFDQTPNWSTWSCFSYNLPRKLALTACPSLPMLPPLIEVGPEMREARNDEARLDESGAGLLNLLLTGCLFTSPSGADRSPSPRLASGGTTPANRTAPAAEGPRPQSPYHQRRPAPRCRQGPGRRVWLARAAAPAPAFAGDSAHGHCHPDVHALEAPLVAALHCALEKHPEKANRLLEGKAQPNRESLALLRLAADWRAAT